jgi:hypothetical protein
MKFQGSENYVATQDLMLAVNAAITLQRHGRVHRDPEIIGRNIVVASLEALDVGHGACPACNRY